VPFTNLTCK